MNKLISNPTECGYRMHHRVCDFICGKVSGETMLICDDKTKFPTNCPLQDGMTHEQWLEQQKPNIIHIRSLPYSHKCIKCHLIFRDGIVHLSRKDCICPTCLGKDVKPKRRNRKDCVCHVDRYDSQGRCTSYKRFDRLCKGVNCGYFKSKSNDR